MTSVEPGSSSGDRSRTILGRVWTSTMDNHRLGPSVRRRALSRWLGTAPRGTVHRHRRRGGCQDRSARSCASLPYVPIKGTCSLSSLPTTIGRLQHTSPPYTHTPAGWKTVVLRRHEWHAAVMVRSTNIVYRSRLASGLSMVMVRITAMHWARSRAHFLSRDVSRRHWPASSSSSRPPGHK